MEFLPPTPESTEPSLEESILRSTYTISIILNDGTSVHHVLSEVS